MLLGSRLRQHLAGLKAIVLDEVHDLAASERGSQLLVGIERIEDYCSAPIQRIGLSATVGNPNEVAKWMSDSTEPVIGPAPRTTRLLVHREPASAEDELLSVELNGYNTHKPLGKSASTARLVVAKYLVEPKVWQAVGAVLESSFHRDIKYIHAPSELNVSDTEFCNKIYTATELQAITNDIL